jgi:hypothetical protein
MSRWKTRPRKLCCWGGDPRCREPATAGRFGHFCTEHAAILARITVARGTPARPGPRAAPPPEPTVVCSLPGCERKAWAESVLGRCYTHRLVPAAGAAPVPGACLVVGCGGHARPGRPTCGRHKLADLTPAALAAFRIEQAAKPRAKAGRKPKVVA